MTNMGYLILDMSLTVSACGYGSHENKIKVAMIRLKNASGQNPGGLDGGNGAVRPIDRPFPPWARASRGGVPGLRGAATSKRSINTIYIDGSWLGK
jgi:hypothetical protein